MLSEDRSAQALHVLAAPMERYRSAVASILEEVRGLLAAQRRDEDGCAEQLKAELGRFAEGRISAGRLVGMLHEKRAVDPLALSRLERAYETLRETASREHELFCVKVPPGGDLTRAVAVRLAESGRVFGAARVAEAARGGLALSSMSDNKALAGFDFSHWTSRERRLAPPLLVSVGGADLRAGGLAEFLDGGQQIVLVVEGACAPAPLVRLITPGTLVIQTDEARGLGRLGGWAGPAVAALLPSAAARFIHDPTAGGEPRQRLKLEYMPEAPRGRVGGLSATQQAEEMRQLAALAAEPAPAARAAPGSAVSPGTPAERLAAWLLSQADFSDPN